MYEDFKTSLRTAETRVGACMLAKGTITSILGVIEFMEVRFYQEIPYILTLCPQKTHSNGKDLQDLEASLDKITNVVIECVQNLPEAQIAKCLSDFSA